MRAWLRAPRVRIRGAPISRRAYFAARNAESTVISLAQMALGLRF
jgi:hypothetical protein